MNGGRRGVQNWLPLAGILAAAIVLRGVLCVHGGQFYSGDENVHFAPGFAAAGTLIGGHARDAARNLLSQQHHAGFRLSSFLVAFTAFALMGDAAYAHVWIMAWLLSLASVAVIALVYGLARRTGATPDEATVAALLAASATSLTMYARHLLPYDAGLALDLLALWIGIRPGGVRRAFVVGVVAAFGFLTYYAYLAVALLAVAVHAVIGRQRGRRALALMLGAAVPFAAFEIVSLTYGRVLFPGREPYHAALWTLLHGAPESWGSSYAEGWWVPWAYLWHAEHLLLPVWLALMVFGWRVRRVRLWGAAAFALYGWLAVHSVVLHEAVVLGRFARQVVPFVCLAAAAGYAALRVRTTPKVVGWALYAVMLVVNFMPLITQRFPADMRRDWSARVGPLAYDVTLDGPHGNPGDVTSRYLALNIEPNLMTWPVDGLRDVVITGTLLEAYPHPLAWRAAQYEGYTQEARATLRARPYRMELWRREKSTP